MELLLTVFSGNRFSRLEVLAEDGSRPAFAGIHQLDLDETLMSWEEVR